MKEKEKPWLDLWLILSVGILAILVLYVIKRNKCIKDRSCCANDEDDVEQVWALTQLNIINYTFGTPYGVKYVLTFVPTQMTQ